MIYERAWNTAPLTKRAPSSLSPSSLLLSERLIVSMSVIWIIFFQTMIGIKSCFQMMINIKSFLHLKQCERSESESCSVVSDSLWPHILYSPWNTLGQNTGVRNLSLLWGIFPIEPRSPALQADSLPAEPQGKFKNTGAGSLSLLSRSSQPRNQTRVSCTAGRFFINWTMRKRKK